MFRSKIIGILNVTPDSFSGEGKICREDALNHLRKLIDNGADIIDIGAESTRPGASAVGDCEEFDRLKLILPQAIDIAHRSRIKISVDTRKSEIAEYAIKLGADYLNDVSGFSEQSMICVAQNSSADLILMHNLGIPSDPARHIAENLDPVDVIVEFFKQRIAVLIEAGIAQNRIILDPGLGFGKTAKQSWYIVRNIEKIKVLGYRICIGHSRKSMFSMLKECPSEPSERDIETLALSLFLAKQRIACLRVHNVAMHNRAFAVTQFSEIID